MTSDQAKREVAAILLDGRRWGLQARTIAKALTLWSKKRKFQLPTDVFEWLGEDDPRFRIKMKFH